MNGVRSEIRTGALVLFSVAVLLGVLAYLGAPGLLRHRRQFRVYFDDAGGIQPGAPVMLAGRRVGSVTKLISPVPQAERPRPNLEMALVVEVNNEAMIYRKSRVVMLQYSLLGDQVINFTGGSEASGLATPETKFIGERQAGINDAASKIIEEIDPVMKSAVRTLEEMQKTSARLTALIQEGADLPVVLSNFKTVSANLLELTGSHGPLNRTLDRVETLTGDGSPLSRSLQNIQALTDRLAANPDIDASLHHFRRASEKLDTTASGLRATVGDLHCTVQSIQAPLDTTLHNAAQFTDTVKRQPWRLIWPTTKKYPEDTAPLRKAFVWRPPWVRSTVTTTTVVTPLPVAEKPVEPCPPAAPKVRRKVIPKKSPDVQEPWAGRPTSGLERTLKIPERRPQPGLEHYLGNP